jgi:heme iron utilization protein
MENKTNKADQLKMALELLKETTHGILSTQSIDLPGFPFGSLTPFCLDHNNELIIYVSHLAQHTKNMNQDSKVSLTVVKDTEEEEKQAHARYTYLAEASIIEENSEDYKETSRKYFEKFPASEEYSSAHGFNFYRLNFVRGRYIGGFGKIFWINKET